MLTQRRQPHHSLLEGRACELFLILWTNVARSILWVRFFFFFKCVCACRLQACPSVCIQMLEKEIRRLPLSLAALFLLLSYFCLFNMTVCAPAWVYHTCIQKSEDTLQNLVSSFHYVGPRDHVPISAGTFTRWAISPTYPLLKKIKNFCDYICIISISLFPFLRPDPPMYHFACFVSNSWSISFLNYFVWCVCARIPKFINTICSFNIACMYNFSVLTT